MDKTAPFDYLLNAARWAPSADNSQPWHLHRDDETLTASYDAARVEGETFGPDDPATLLAMGAVLENVLQAAAATGMEVVSEPHAPHEYFRLRISPSSTSTLGSNDHPLFLRHTNRWPFRTDPLPDALTKGLMAHGEGTAHVMVLDSPSQLKRIANLVKNASAIRFQTRESNESLGRSLRFGPGEVESGTGLDISTLSLPPGGKSLMRLISDWRRMESLNRWGAYKLFAAIEGKSITSASAIVAIFGAAGRQGALDAGQLMERVWIHLNHQELGVQPFYVVSDQLFRRDDGLLPPGTEPPGDALARDADDLFALGDKKLYMLLRVGYPTRNPVKSRRLPLTSICMP